MDPPSLATCLHLLLFLPQLGLQVRVLNAEVKLKCIIAWNSACALLISACSGSEVHHGFQTGLKFGQMPACSAGCVLPALPGTRQDLQRHLQRPNSTNIVSLQLLISYSLCLQDTITSSSKKLQAMAKSPNPGASSKLHQPAVVLAGRSDTWQGSPLIPGQEPTTSSHVLKPTSP